MHEFREPRQFRIKRIFFDAKDNTDVEKSPLAELVGVKEDEGLISGGSIKNVKKQLASSALKRLEEGEDLK
jgi:hypothetical protein